MVTKWMGDHYLLLFARLCTRPDISSVQILQKTFGPCVYTCNKITLYTHVKNPVIHVRSIMEVYTKSVRLHDVEVRHYPNERKKGKKKGGGELKECAAHLADVQLEC